MGNPERRHAIRRTLRPGIALVLLMLCGCDRVFEVEYGAEEGHSVNGFRTLRGAVTTVLKARSERVLGPELERTDGIVLPLLDAGWPDPEVWEWLSTWAWQREDRMVVLLLADGGVADYLCQRWTAEAEEACRTATDPSVAARFRALAEALRHFQSTAEAASPRLKGPSASPGDHDLRLAPALRGQPQVLRSGTGFPALSGLPPTLRLPFAPRGKEAETLVEVDGHAWLTVAPLGEGRLVVAANATPLVDGALAHPHGRALLDALLRWLNESGPRRRWAWVERCALRVEPPQHPNLLAALLRPPYVWVLAQLLLIGILAAAWRGLWPHRRLEPQDRSPERFGRHIRALAVRLAASRSHRACLAAIARQFGLTPPPAATEESALAAARRLFEPGSRSTVDKTPSPANDGPGKE